MSKLYIKGNVIYTELLLEYLDNKAYIGDDLTNKELRYLFTLEDWYDDFSDLSEEEYYMLYNKIEDSVVIDYMSKLIELCLPINVLTNKQIEIRNKLTEWRKNDKGEW